MRTLLSLCLAVAVVTACGERASGREAEAPISVTEIDVGRSVKADRTIDDATSSFEAQDVIYVSIGTKGEGPGTLRARWVFGENEEIAAEERAVAAEGPTHTQFQLSRPGGLAKGEYRVEISLNGVAQGHERFTVN
jgi:hypothetical protein